MKPGIYDAKLLGWGFGKQGKNQTPFIMFNVHVFENPSAPELMQWQGWLTDSSRLNTEKALAVLDFDGNWAKIADCASGLNKDKVFEVTVEDEIYEGKSNLKIKWINEKGASRAKLFDKKDTLIMLSSLGLISGAKSSEFTADSIPF